PWITATAEGATRRARARRRATARFASPSTGGAVTRTRREPSRQPRIASLEARGWTRTLSTAPSGLLLAAVVPELGRHRPVVALERRAEVLDELTLHAAEGQDLAPELSLLAPHSLEQLLTPQLGLAHVDLRSLSQTQAKVAQGIDHRPLDELDHEQDDHGRQVEPRGDGRQAVADRAEHRLRDTVEEAHHRVEGIRAHPGEDRARDDDPEI